MNRKTRSKLKKSQENKYNTYSTPRVERRSSFACSSDGTLSSFYTRPYYYDWVYNDWKPKKEIERVYSDKDPYGEEVWD
jgi:hypothetical protein